MGLRGPRPTPTAMLKARGTYRADRARKERGEGAKWNAALSRRFGQTRQTMLEPVDPDADGDGRALAHRPQRHHPLLHRLEPVEEAPAVPGQER